MLKQPSSILQKQLILFLGIGLINTLFGYCMFSILIFLKFHYTLASLLSTVAGILFNFKTTGGIVFKNRDNSRIYRFFAIYALLYLINISLLKIGSFITDNMYLIGAVAVILTAGISFMLNKFIVFQETSYETH